LKRITSAAAQNSTTTTCKTYKDDDPLPFLKKSSSKSESDVDFDSELVIATRKRHSPNNPMVKIIHQGLQEEIDLAI
jgi:hypothetical protein